MAASGSGIDIKKTTEGLVITASIKDLNGAKVTSGTTTLRIGEWQDDATLKTYDFASNTFKSTTVTTETQAMTNRPMNNGATATSLWSTVVSTLSGFTKGAKYVVVVTNTNGFSPEQEREFQFGGADGDLIVTPVGYLGANVEQWKAATAPPMTGDAYSVVSDAAFGNAALRTLVSALPSVASIVAGVWGAASRTLSAFGFTVSTNENATEAAIASVIAKLDTMLENVAGQYRFDSASLANVSGALTGDQATKLNQIFAKTALLGTQGVTVVGPHTQEGALDIIRGFEYTLDSGFAPKWSRDDWPPLAGATVSLVELSSPHTQIATGSVVVAGSESEMQTVALHMPGDLTTGLTASTKAVLVQAVLDGMTYPVPLLRVEMKVS